MDCNHKNNNYQNDDKLIAEIQLTVYIQSFMAQASLLTIYTRILKYPTDLAIYSK